MEELGGSPAKSLLDVCKEQSHCIFDFFVYCAESVKDQWKEEVGWVESLTMKEVPLFVYHHGLGDCPHLNRATVNIGWGCWVVNANIKVGRGPPRDHDVMVRPSQGVRVWAGLNKDVESKAGEGSGNLITEHVVSADGVTLEVWADKEVEVHHGIATGTAAIGNARRVEAKAGPC